METLFQYFWLLQIGINIVNSVIFWLRAQPYIKKQPDLRSGYIKMIRGFFVGMSVPWVVMGIGLTTGAVSNIAAYFYPRAGNQLVMAWWVSIWGLILSLSYWILFRGGAESLINYPVFFRGNPKNPKTIKLVCFLSLIVSLVAFVIIFYLWPISGFTQIRHRLF